MHITFTDHASTVGREDRLVRGCIALSLLLLSGFAIAASGGVGIISALFGLIGVYFALTAIAGRDPFYRRYGIDTHGYDDPRTEPGAPTVLDLRQEQPASASDQLD